MKVCRPKLRSEKFDDDDYNNNNNNNNDDSNNNNNNSDDIMVTNNNNSCTWNITHRLLPSENRTLNGWLHDLFKMIFGGKITRD